MKRKSDRPRGRPVMGNVKVQFNIRPEVSEIITKAAAKFGITRSQYIQDLVTKNATKTPLK